MKTDLTKLAEKRVWESTQKMGVFGCFEVTIGFNGDERVDYITYDTSGIVRCYEIKVSMSDLKSEAKQTFLGDYNYLVVPNELWGKMQNDNRIMWKYHYQGVLVFEDTTYGYGLVSAKKAKKKQVNLGTKVTILESMVRSLNREVGKLYKVKPFWKENNE